MGYCHHTAQLDRYQARVDHHSKISSRADEIRRSAMLPGAPTSLLTALVIDHEVTLDPSFTDAAGNAIDAHVLRVIDDAELGRLLRAAFADAVMRADEEIFVARANAEIDAQDREAAQDHAEARAQARWAA